jgi:hypothetical protein
VSFLRRLFSAPEPDPVPEHTTADAIPAAPSDGGPASDPGGSDPVGHVGVTYPIDHPTDPAGSFFDSGPASDPGGSDPVGHVVVTYPIDHPTDPAGSFFDSGPASDPSGGILSAREAAFDPGGSDPVGHVGVTYPIDHPTDPAGNGGAVSDETGIGPKHDDPAPPSPDGTTSTIGGPGGGPGDMGIQASAAGGGTLSPTDSAAGGSDGVGSAAPDSQDAPSFDDEGPSTLLGGGDSLGDGVVVEGGFDPGTLDTGQFDTEGAVEP